MIAIGEESLRIHKEYSEKRIHELIYTHNCGSYYAERILGCDLPVALPRFINSGAAKRVAAHYRKQVF